MASVFGETGDRDTGLATRTAEVLGEKKQVTVPTGIPGFDEALGQGLPAGNLYLVSGTLSSGAIQFAQEILYNTIIARGKVAYYTVENPSTDVMQDMQLVGMNIQQYVDDGTWVFGRVVPPKMKKVIDSLPEIPMEQRIDLDDTFTKLMNHFHGAAKDGRNTAIHLPLLVRNYSLDELQNLIFFMKGVSRKFGGVHFLLLTAGALAENISIAIKDSTDTVFEITTATRGTEIENTVAIQKIRGMIPKVRAIKLTQRGGRLATETIRRVQ